MMTDNRTCSNRSSAWQSKMAAGICLALLMAVAAAGQDKIQEEFDASALNHPIPSAPKKSYAPASVQALPELQCLIYPEGGATSTGLTVFTDDDGYARFHAVRAAAGDKVRRLTLDCKDSNGSPFLYSIDLTSDDTFAPRPVNLAYERGTDRPGLTGDPLSYTQTELIQAGYGLRPDPEQSPAAYSRWLAAAVQPGRMLEAKRPSTHSHTVTKKTAPAWVGSVLAGSPKYLSIEGNFNVPAGIPGGDETIGTEISIWNGLGGYNTGSGLIQAGVSLQTSQFVATYGSWREFCCGGPGGDSNGYGGAFVPNPGDEIFAQNWYCDANGNINIKGGYGCSYLKDFNTGAILSCTSPTGSPCWSAKAHSGMTLGVNAEWVIENQSGQCCKPAVQFTDLASRVTMTGSAWSAKTGQFTQTISNDSKIFLLTDFTNSTSHMNVSLGDTDQTYFDVSQFASADGVDAQAEVMPCSPPSNGLCNPLSIAVGPNAEGSTIGDAWVVGNTKAKDGDDYLVYRWENSKWAKQSGISGIMIAVSPNGVPWVVNHLGKISYLQGSTWEPAPGNACATSIGIGPNAFGLKYGDPWIIGCDGGWGTDGGIYQLQGSTWVKQAGTGSQIAVSPDLGIPWVLKAGGDIYIEFGSALTKYTTACATSIAVGPLSAAVEYADAFGDVWITGCNGGALPPDESPIYQLQFGNWVQVPGSASEIAVSPDLGVPWIVHSTGQISR
jgi:hypothetical protein